MQIHKDEKDRISYDQTLVTSTLITESSEIESLLFPCKLNNTLGENYSHFPQWLGQSETSKNSEFKTPVLRKIKNNHVK